MGGREGDILLDVQGAVLALVVRQYITNLWKGGGVPDRYMHQLNKAYFSVSLQKTPPTTHDPKFLFQVSSRLLGPVDPSFRALSGRLKFTVRRHTFNKDSPFLPRVASSIKAYSVFLSTTERDENNFKFCLVEAST